MKECIYGLTDLVTGDVSAFVRFDSDDAATSFCRAICRSLCFCSDRSHLIPRDELASRLRDVAIMRFGEFGIVGDDKYPSLIPCTPTFVAALSPIGFSEWDLMFSCGYSVNVSRETSEGDDSSEES